ncbi:MAG: hypothetical protein K9M98_04070 [Cephaloticoccus sp.]|nr:hypothetical protein [Cephaloticoccus sp.]MCF7759659.1 hypothetical protein [Cephaloticoccus sp.]
MMTPSEKPASYADILFPRMVDRTELHLTRKNLPRYEAGLRQILRDCG